MFSEVTVLKSAETNGHAVMFPPEHKLMLPFHLSLPYTDTYFSYFKSNESAMGAPIQRIDLRGKIALW